MEKLSFDTKTDIALQKYKVGGFLTTLFEENLNTMTVSWGSIGYMWNVPTFTITVRKARYSYDLLEKSNEFTISIPFEPFKEELAFCGSNSGKNIDKFKACNLEPKASLGIKTPIINCKGIHYECVVIHKSDMVKDIVSDELKSKFYLPSNDYHTIYYGQIINTYEL